MEKQTQESVLLSFGEGSEIIKFKYYSITLYSTGFITNPQLLVNINIEWYFKCRVFLKLRPWSTVPVFTIDIYVGTYSTILNVYQCGGLAHI